jgi:hypothetical protein
VAEVLRQRLWDWFWLTGRNSFLLHDWQIEGRTGVARRELVAKLRRVDASQVRSTCRFLRITEDRIINERGSFEVSESSTLSK